MIKKTDTIKAPPLFSKGCLTFKNSTHTLTENGKYYRCSLKTNGFCIKESEGLIVAKDLEDKLARLLEKFLLPEGTALILYEKLMTVWVMNMMKSGNRDMHAQNDFEATGNLMIADLRAGKEIQKADYLEFKRKFLQLAKNFYSNILLGSLINFLSLLIKNKPERDEMNSYMDKFFKIPPQKLHQSFALQLKKIYISDDGKIENIEFEGFAWFIFQYFKKMIPEYQPKIKEGFILNTKKFPSLDYDVVMEEFMKNDLADTYSYNSFYTKYAKEKWLKKVFGDFEKLSTQEKIDYLIRLNSPTPENTIASFSTILRN